jgi:hypothetical protein
MIPPFAHLAKYRSKMTATEKSSKKGLVILFVGMMIGIGVGIAACVTAMAHFSSPSATTVASQVPHSAPHPLPSLLPAPAQTASLDTSNAGAISTPSTYIPAPQPQVPQEAYQQIPAVVPTTAPTIISQQYSQDGSVFLPASTTVIDTSPIVITAGSVNPNWTMGKNGLIQNPCVDPPSAHGRATGQY